MIELALGHFGWSPQTFWKATKYEFMAAFRGKFPDTKDHKGALASRMHIDKTAERKRVLSETDKIEQDLRAKGVII